MLVDAGLKDVEIGEIRKDDVLLVIDMQQDFMPVEDAPLGGRFGVAVNLEL